jgi:hypothetical protein
MDITDDADHLSPGVQGVSSDPFSHIGLRRAPELDRDLLWGDAGSEHMTVVGGPSVDSLPVPPQHHAPVVK